MQNNINNDICKNCLRAILQQSNKTDEIFMFWENERRTNDRFKKKKDFWILQTQCYVLSKYLYDVMLFSNL